uniref:Uncharacterized protein n=1 Tax=Plectus sambesii TaxID=2011161 RepID=A0A914X1V7_9BILA
MHHLIAIIAICVSLLAVEAGWLDDLAEAASDVSKSTGEWAQGAAKDTIKAAQHAGKLTGDWLKTAGTDVLEKAGEAGEDVGGWLKEAGQAIKDHPNNEVTSNNATQ